MKGVITADIVHSSQISAEKRKALLDTLKKVEKDLQKFCEIHIEVYRGDSFQVLVNEAGKVVLCAVLIRAMLKSKSWDARMSIGIGDVSYLNEHVTQSDGEAFWLSGRNFDDIGKSRLRITTPEKGINEELVLTSAFADDIISNWSTKQAACIYQTLAGGLNRKELAEQTGTTVQNIGKTLRAAKESLIVAFIKRCEYLIINYIKK